MSRVLFLFLAHFMTTQKTVLRNSSEVKKERTCVDTQVTSPFLSTFIKFKRTKNYNYIDKKKRELIISIESYVIQSISVNSLFYGITTTFKENLISKIHSDPIICSSKHHLYKKFSSSNEYLKCELFRL